MRIALFVLLAAMFSGCGPSVILDADGPSARADCEARCQSKYKTSCHFVGTISGNYYCK